MQDFLIWNAWIIATKQTANLEELVENYLSLLLCIIAMFLWLFLFFPMLHWRGRKPRADQTHKCYAELHQNKWRGFDWRFIIIVLYVISLVCYFFFSKSSLDIIDTAEYMNWQQQPDKIARICWGMRRLIGAFVVLTCKNNHFLTTWH